MHFYKYTITITKQAIIEKERNSEMNGRLCIFLCQQKVKEPNSFN